MSAKTKNAKTKGDAAMQLMVFSKHLVAPSLGEIGRRLKAMGVDAIDLTVRPGGHIEPEKVEDDLPRAAQELGEQGVRIGMLTTEITTASDRYTEPVLRTAHRLGIRHYKLGYYFTGEFGTLRRVRDEAAAKLRELAALNLEIGIQGGFHNHSGWFLGASLGDIDFLLRDIEPAVMGVYFDAAHATIEGGGGGWRQGLDLLHERIVMVAVKDYEWSETSGNAMGRRFKVRWCPLENGNVRWPEVLQHLRNIGFAGPVSLHSEYQGSHSFRDLSDEEIFEQTALDLATFRAWDAAIAP